MSDVDGAGLGAVGPRETGRREADAQEPDAQEPDVARIRVLLVDDEVLIRAGVRAILATDPAIEIVAEASDGGEGVHLAAAHRPDVVLLDIRMPVLDGLAAARDMHALVPESRVVMLTTFGEDEYIVEALRGHAAGFLLKASDPRELLAGVHAVNDGAAYLSPRIAHRVIRRFQSGETLRDTVASRRAGHLTDRERDVLALVGAGLSNAEIGRSLYLVEGTVKGHVSAILDKLDARNRVQAAVIAYQAGLVPPPDKS